MGDWVQDRCRKWLEESLPEMATSLGLGQGQGQGEEGGEGEDGGEEAEGKKGRQKRGGRGAPKPPKPKAAAAMKLTLQRAPRGKNKSVTVIKGLGSCGLLLSLLLASPLLHLVSVDLDMPGIDVKVAAKFFAGKFACGSSVTGGDEIVIQGDVKDDLFDLIPEKWPQVTSLLPSLLSHLHTLTPPQFQIDEDVIEDLGDQKR